jgi:hypothetical protein
VTLSNVNGTYELLVLSVTDPTVSAAEFPALAKAINTAFPEVTGVAKDPVAVPLVTPVNGVEVGFD